MTAGAAQADGFRTYLSIVGSSSLAPFSEAVSDRITKSGKIKQPKLESTGTGGGFALFCEGVGMEHPDVVNAGRRIHAKELDACQRNGVGNVVEIKIGYDGVVLADAQKGAALTELSRKDLYLALAKQIIDPNCKDKCDTLVPNPYKTWKQVNPALPDSKIEVYGPPVSASIRDTYGDLVMGTGCAAYPQIAKQSRSEAEFKRLCYSVREDGAYIEDTDENRAGAVLTNPNAVGLFTYTWLKRHSERLKPLSIEGVVPTDDSIVSQRYPIASGMYFYVKKAHVERVPGLPQYLAEFTGDKAWGDKGYLLAAGLIPMPKEERARYAADAKALTPLLSLDPAVQAAQPKPVLPEEPARPVKPAQPAKAAKPSQPTKSTKPAKAAK
ncbi:substrate-binding domain-containing protein [Methylococcus sp. EFPC2]|nr:substrate-binding domain-containing protein [Methylococcus sp. EFPC2]